MEILTVTNLNDTGPGSLREALIYPLPRRIEFGVSGTIWLTSTVNVKNPCLEIAGETAPKGGVCIAGGFIGSQTKNLKIRHVRMRPGAGLGVLNTRCIQIIDGAYDNVIENCSMSWSVDENATIWAGNEKTIRNIVFRDCIISEGLYESIEEKGIHSMGAIVGGGATNVSFIRCLFAHNNQRNPLINCGRVDIINCVIYGTGGHNGQFYDYHGWVVPSEINLINNYYKIPNWSTYNTTRVFIYTYDMDKPTVTVYESGNVVDGHPEIEKVCMLGDDQIASGLTLADVTTSARYPMLTHDKMLSAKDAYTYVLKNAGATLPARDAVDTRIVNDVINGTGGLIDDPSEIGGWPEL